MNSIVAALKKLFSLESDPKTIAEALDEAESISGLPAVTADDNGKILKVVDGVWTAATP